MERHFTWLNSVVPVDEGAEKFGTGIVIGVLLILLGVISTRRLRTEEGIKESIVPPEKMRLFGFFDLFIEGFIGFHDSILGKENRKYASFSGSIFIFLFALNLLGLIPGMPAATTTVWLMQVNLD